MSDVTSTELTTLHQLKKPSRFIPLTILFIGLLLFFTLTKLPQNKVTNLIQGTLQLGLDPMGIYLTDRGREFSILKGFEYRLDHPAFELPDGTRIEMDEIVVSPSLLMLLKGKAGAVMTLTQGTSKIELSGSGRGDQVSAHIKLDQCDLAKLGAFAFIGAIKGEGQVSGEVQVDGSLSDLSTLNGSAQIKLRKIKLDEQNLMGFQLPALQISDGTIDVNLDQGKVSAKNVSLGKASDDIQITVTGDMKLNKNVYSTPLNFRAVLGLSDRVKQSIAILDSVLGDAKQKDGKYAYKLTGMLGSPFPVPDPQK